MNKKIPKKIFQIKFITAIDQVSISKKFQQKRDAKDDFIVTYCKNLCDEFSSESIFIQ